MKNYINPDGTQYRKFAGTIPLESDIDNPYWIINKDNLTSKTNRFTGGVNANFKVTNWWDITARLGMTSTPPTIILSLPRVLR